MYQAIFWLTTKIYQKFLETFLPQLAGSLGKVLPNDTIQQMFGIIQCN